MRVLIQRVRHAGVSVDGEQISSIAQGLLVFVGITASDTSEIAMRFAHKVAQMRIFEDDQQKMNRSVLDVHGAILVVSQFTLYGNPLSGRRPDFIQAARPEFAEPLYELFVNEIMKQGVKVATGRFGADMKVELLNDGPVTLWMDSKDL